MSGSGTTVLASGATGSHEESYTYLVGRTFTNEGTFTLSSGYISMEEGATIHNSGTLNVNSEGTAFVNESGKGPEPVIVNTGTLQKTAGAETYIGISVENLGTINGKTGLISFQART